MWEEPLVEGASHFQVEHCARPAPTPRVGHAGLELDGIVCLK